MYTQSNESFVKCPSEQEHLLPDYFDEGRDRKPARDKSGGSSRKWKSGPPLRYPTALVLFHPEVKHYRWHDLATAVLLVFVVLFSPLAYLRTAFIMINDDLSNLSRVR